MCASSSSDRVRGLSLAELTLRGTNSNDTESSFDRCIAKPVDKFLVALFQIDRRDGVDLDQVSMMKLGHGNHCTRGPRIAKRRRINYIKPRLIFYINYVRGYLQYMLR